MNIPPLNLVSSFVTFNNSKNMVSAAEILGVSQSTLTSHLQDFETYFDLKVFVMEGRKKALTPFGIKLQEVFSKRIQGLKGDIENIVQRFKNPEDAVISISGRTEIINFIGREVSFPGKVIFKYGDGASVIEDLLEKRTDLIISNHREKTDDLTSKRLFVDEFFLAVPKKWNDGIETLSKALVERLLTRPYLQYKNNDYVIDLVLMHFNISKQIEPKTVLPDWPSLIYLAEKEGGWVIAPTRYQNLSGNKLVKIAVPTSIVPKTEFYILYRKENFDKKWLAPTLDKIKDIFTIS